MNAPPRWSSIGSHSAAALGPTAATTPPAASTPSIAAITGVSLSTLRRCIDESPTSQTARAPGTTPAAPSSSASWRCSTISASTCDLQPLGPGHRGRDQRRRLLERVGRREHDDPVGAGGGQQPAVEVVVGGERSAAEQGDGPGHGGRSYGGRTGGDHPLDRSLPLGCYSRVTRLRAMGEINTVGHRRIGDHGLGHRRGGGQGRARGRRSGRGSRRRADAHRRRRSAKSSTKQVEKGKLEAAERDAIARPGHGHRPTSADLADCDLVIESVVEDLAVKKELFAELDADRASPTRILATNTSTLPVVELAVQTAAPRAGVRHPLLQPGADDERWSRSSARSPPATRRSPAHGVRRRRCGKDAVEVKDRAGFIVNALLFPYLNNAVRMLENGTASRDDIDTAMKGGCNFPMGPLALLDLVGLDTSLAILDALYDEFRDPNYAAVPTLRRMVAAGQLGRKSGAGFYDY